MTGKNASVLVVDDEADLRVLICTELRLEGYQVVAASDGGEALDLLGGCEFDVVVSDLRMPGPSGLEVLRAVRRDAPATEVVLATGYASAETAVQCLQEGAFDLVRKPFAMGDLLDTVGRAVARRQARGTGAQESIRRRVLFVDDEPALLRVYQRLLAGDHEVVVAQGGPAARAVLAERQDFDAVVSDLLMSELDGMELYRQVCAAHPALAGRFLFVTGAAAHPQVAAFVAGGAGPLLEKPFDFAALRAAIARAPYSVK